MSLKDKNVTENDVSQILKSHIISRNSNDSFLAEIDIDPRSLLIKGKKAKHFLFPKRPFLSNRIIERFFKVENAKCAAELRKIIKYSKRCRKMKKILQFLLLF